MSGVSECITIPPSGTLGWLDLIALVLVVLSSLSWAYDALVLKNPISSLLGVDKVGASAGARMTARGLYALVGLAAAYLLGRLVYSYYQQKKQK